MDEKDYWICSRWVGNRTVWDVMSPSPCKRVVVSDIASGQEAQIICEELNMKARSLGWWNWHFSSSSAPTTIIYGGVEYMALKQRIKELEDESRRLHELLSEIEGVATRRWAKKMLER